MKTNQQQGSALQTGFRQKSELTDLVLKARPAKPLYVLYPDRVRTAAKEFIAAFPGIPLYAVKTNPDPVVLKSLYQAGVENFDVASIAEIKAVKAVAPMAGLHFMHTIKAPEDIHAAYFDYGVRHFVLDCEEELFKIMRETELAQDLDLTVRIALPKNETALIDFSNKFGAHFEQAIDLLQKCRPVSQKFSISFHVGTQTTSAEKYRTAIHYAARVINAADVTVDRLDVGGGFPVAYEGDENNATVGDCVQCMKEALSEHGLSNLELLAEPGRILVAQAASLVARVEMRKGDLLYLNDGVYGGLFDAAKWVGTRYPVSAISCDRPFEGITADFRLAGPTCDSLDMMEGPFNLPADIGIGDWIVFENTGAYSQVLRSDFNGFGHADIVVV
jgi:ornithine decarboxylase